MRWLRDGGYTREERREILEDPDERAFIFLPSQEERKKEDEEIRWNVYRWVFRLSVASGVGAAVCTGQLRWIPIGLAVGIGGPIVGGICNYFGEVISEPWD